MMITKEHQKHFEKTKASRKFMKFQILLKLDQENLNNKIGRISRS